MQRIQNQPDDQLQIINQTTTSTSSQSYDQNHHFNQITTTICQLFNFKLCFVVLTLIGMMMIVNFKTAKQQTLAIENIKLKEQLQRQSKTIEEMLRQAKLMTSNIEHLNLQMAKMQQYQTKVEQQGTQATASMSLYTQQQLIHPSQLKYDISKLQNPQRVVQIKYGPGSRAKLPLNTLNIKRNCQKIEQILYPDAQMRNKRISFQKQRKKFIQANPKFYQLYLIEFNNPLDEETEKRGILQNQRQWVRLQKKFSLSKISTELPICLIVPGYNNNERFRIEHNLNSIFMQNYTNYKAVIIDDASTDGSFQTYKKYFQFYKIDKKHYTLISNTKKITALPNHYFGTLLHCGKDSIVLNLDGDDELIGRNVFKIFNWAYQTKKPGVVYSNFYWYQQRNSIIEDQKKNNLYRTTLTKFSHLRSYRAQLLHQVDPKEFMDLNGHFFTITYDVALILPLMELSCGRVHRIQGQFHYLYNVGTGLNDYNNRERQMDVQNHIRNQKQKYECWKQFDQRMNK